MTKCHSKDILERYKDNTIMDKFEKNTGILTKDFIKKLLNRENELENTIFELGEQIKALKSSENNKENDIPKGYNIFMKMIKYASFSWNAGDSSIMNMPTISINDYPLASDEINYINRLIRKRQEEEDISATLVKTTSACTSAWNKTSITAIDGEYCFDTKACDIVNVGTGGSSRWQDNLINDRVWS